MSYSSDSSDYSSSSASESETEAEDNASERREMASGKSACHYAPIYAALIHFDCQRPTFYL